MSLIACCLLVWSPGCNTVAFDKDSHVPRSDSYIFPLPSLWVQQQRDPAWSTCTRSRGPLHSQCEEQRSTYVLCVNVKCY